MKKIIFFFALACSASAQVKVSELPAASTLGGTEVFPTVQSATTKKATAAQIAEYARGVAAATLAPKASPTFTGTVTIPSGASIADYLSTATAASTYQPLDSGLTAFAGLADAAGVLANNGSGTLFYQGTSTGTNGATDSGKLVVFQSNGSINATTRLRAYSSSNYTEMNILGLANTNGTWTQAFRWHGTPTANRVVTLPDATGTVALESGPLGTPSSVTLTNATGLPIASGISGLGTGIATALAANVGSAGAPVLNGGALGTPASGTGTNITGIPPANVTGTAAVLGTNAFTGAQTLSANGAVSAPVLALTGAPYSGGTSETTKPLASIETTGATSNAWSTGGTMLGVNAPSGFSGDLISGQRNGLVQFSVQANGPTRIIAPSGDNRIMILNSRDSFLNDSGYFAIGGAGNLYWNGPLEAGGYFRQTVSPGAGESVYFYVDNSNISAQRFGTHAQTKRIYRTYTDGGNYERTAIQSGSGYIEFAAETAGTGVDDLDVRITPAGTGGVVIGIGSAPVKNILSAVATKDFDLTAVTLEDQTMTVTGVAVGDSVQLGVPDGSVTATASFSAWVSAADTVTIRCKTQAAGENPPSGSFRATVTKH